MKYIRLPWLKTIVSGVGDTLITLLMMMLGSFICLIMVV